MAVQTRGAAVSIGTALLLASAGYAQQYDFALDPSASGVNGTLSATVGTGGTLIGDWDPGTNPGGTRTKPTNSIFDFPGPTQNLSVNTSVDLSADAVLAASSSGGFGLVVDGTVASVSGLAIDLLSGGPITAPISAGLAYESFSTASPNFFYPSVPVDLPLGEATIDALTATQAGVPAVGTVTPTGAFTSEVSIAVPVLLTGSATFQGQSLPIAELPFTLLFVGELTSDFGAATLTGAFDFDLSETATIDAALPEFPLGLPTFGGEAGVLLNLTADTLGIDASGSLNLLASGTIVPGPAGALAFGVLLVRRRSRR